MHQRKYTLELISELGLGVAKPIATPMETNARLTTIEVDKLVNESRSDETDPSVDATGYQKIIGKLLYLTITRPDIAYSVQTLGQFLHQPKQSHLEAGHGVLLSSTSQGQLSAYCDVDWAACPNTRKSLTGYLVKLGDSLISWKSKKQNIVSRSSAEYRSLASTTAELSWILRLFKEIGIQVNRPVQIHIDSKAAMKIAGNLIFH